MNTFLSLSVFWGEIIWLLDRSLSRSIVITLIAFVAVVVITINYNNNRCSVIGYNKTATDYRTASAKITSVEEEDIYIDPYIPKEENLETIPIKPIFVRRDSLSYYNDSENVRERNKLIRMRNSRINMGIHSDKPSEPVHKKRYKVRYEFETTGGKTYSGEGAFFNNKGIEVGRYIEIKYKPDKPQANFPLGNSGM